MGIWISLGRAGRRKASLCIRTSIAHSQHPGTRLKSKEYHAIASRSTSRKPTRSSGGGFPSFLLGFLVCAALASAAWFYLRPTPKPLKSAAAPLVTLPPSTNPQPPKPYIPQPPFGTSEDVFEAGARLYTARCASCHGSPSHPSPLASTMNPAPSQFWSSASRSSALAAKSPGEIFLAIENGLPHTGMPAYRHQLTGTQLWQLALLLKNANQPLPDPVRTILVPE